MITSSRLPYILGVILIAAFIGPLGNSLFLYSTSGDWSSALYGPFIFINGGEAGNIKPTSLDWYIIASNFFWYSFLFYVAFVVKYLRMQLVKAEKELASLAPEGEETVRGVFKHVSRVTPQLIIASLFLLIYALGVMDLVDRGEFTLASGPIYALRSIVRSLLFGSILWVYYGSLWGLYQFGKLKLKLKSFREDLMLGTKRIGYLAFIFSAVFFFGMALFGAQMNLGTKVGQAVVVNVLVMVILIPVGFGLFIAPLVSTHRRMVEAKCEEMSSTGRLLSDFFNDCQERDQKDEQRVIEFMALESSERKMMAIKTWPVENPLVGKLALIACSVSAALIARIIQITIGI